MDGGLVVRHEVLGVRPKHRFVLQNPGRKHTNKNVGRRKQTREKVVRLTEAQHGWCVLSFLLEAVGHARQPLTDFHDYTAF